MKASRLFIHPATSHNSQPGGLACNQSWKKRPSAL